jgi:hypothetical protein
MLPGIPARNSSPDKPAAAAVSAASSMDVPLRKDRTSST